MKSNTITKSRKLPLPPLKGANRNEIVILTLWSWPPSEIVHFRHRLTMGLHSPKLRYRVVLFRFAPRLSKVGRRWRPQISSEEGDTMTKLEKNKSTN